MVEDIWRLERLVCEGVADEGCALVVTNNRGMWRPSATGRKTLGDACWKATCTTTETSSRSVTRRDEDLAPSALPRAEPR